MADDKLVTLERRDDGVAVLRLDNPRMNVLSSALLRQMYATLDGMQGDLPGALVVTGSDRIFSAGADLNEFSGPEAAASTGAVFRETFDALADFPRFTIAAIRGFALGGGCELALSCDFRIAGDAARLGQPEILLGIIPGGGGTQRLPRLVGPAKAKELILTGRQVRSSEALDIGLVDMVVPSEEVLVKALEMASKMAAGPLVAQSLAKRAIDRGMDITLAGGLDLEQQVFVESFKTDDAGIGIASFLEQGPGKARFTGR